jgi:hypothetical protein
MSQATRQGCGSLSKILSQTGFSTNHIGTRANIDPAGWETKARTLYPKCIGVNVIIGGTIVRSFSLIQRDETPQCVNVEFGETFGLIGIRKYYTDHDSYVPPDMIESAVRTLYSKEIPAGISQKEAEQKAEEVCR